MILFALFSLLDNIHICKNFPFKSAGYVQICHLCVFKVTWFSFFFDSLLAHIHMCLKSNTDLILNNQITVHAVSTSFALP